MGSCDNLITSFNIGDNNATISGLSISINVPYGTEVKELVATFAVSEGATVKIAEVVQQSGITKNDFSESVIYTVIAEDGSSVAYTVQVNVLNSGEYGITYYLDDGSWIANYEPVLTFSPVSIVTLPTSDKIIKEGYTFEGWYTDILFTNSITTTVNQTNNLSLYAKWQRITYTITFNSNGGSGSMDSQTVNSGDSITLTSNTFTKEDNTFIGWTDNLANCEKVASDNATYTPTSNVTLYALWELNNYITWYVSNSEETTADGTSSNPYSWSTVCTTISGYTETQTTPIHIILTEDITATSSLAPATDVSCEIKILSNNTDGYTITRDSTLTANPIVSITSGSLFTLENITLDGNSVSASKSLITAYGALTLNYVTLTNNKTTSNGSAIYSTSGQTIIITNSSICNNKAEGIGGAIHFAGTSASPGSLTIKDSSFYQNESKSTGGSIYVEGDSTYATVTIENSYFYNNTATSNGGGLYLKNVSASISSSGIGIDENESPNGNISNADTNTTGGGGIYLSGGTLTLTSTKIANNAVPYNGVGGGVCVNSGSLSVESDSIITNNTVSNTRLVATDYAYGGGVFVNSGALTFADGTITGNTAISGSKYYVAGVATVNEVSVTAGTAVDD